MDQPDSAAYLIVDSEHMDRPTLPLTPFIDGWETVAEMEAALGIPAGNLEKTLQRYNEHAARGEDPDFHKYPKYLAAQVRRSMRDSRWVDSVRMRTDVCSPNPGSRYRVSMRRAPALRTLLRTGRAIAAEPGLAKRRSSAGARVRTRQQGYPPANPIWHAM
ncbi:Possible fumarate reductase/succinate dehydrogenase [Mycobacteroides abscessus subsp. massiliense]|nr:Possible fumarate reductase/succinate dehydrogenase [Mycobacteroides abscessus subsp. massiliense]